VRDQLRDRLIAAAILVASTFTLGVFGYHVIGGDRYTWMEAVYMTANVLTTAGFREAIDVSSPFGEAFTVILLMFGAGVLVYSTSVITAFVVEGDLTQGFRRRRMRRAVDSMRDHHIVCGAGATGWAVLRELATTERPVVVIEQSAERVRRIETEYPKVPVIPDDFTDDQVLAAAGIARARGVVICTTIDKDALVAVITARQLNPNIRIIARAANERGAARLRQAGADSVVSPALIGGMRMASELVRPSVVNFLDTMLRDTNRNLRVEEVHIPPGSPFMTRTLGELNTHSRTNCLLLATRATGGEYVYNPPDEEKLEGGMVLIVMGEPHDVRHLREVCDGTSSLMPPSPSSPSASSPTTA
jgi:voltage-gated potassium channel